MVRGIEPAKRMEQSGRGEVERAQRIDHQVGKR
jgi:hypothetical protein